MFTASRAVGKGLNRRPVTEQDLAAGLGNLLAALAWQLSEWRWDSRIELIFSEAQDIAQLQRGLADCRQ